ncbi:glutaminyl-peptide cyclotransferase [Spirosoma sp. KNUC1025]|uniref:glutaminyl-peptide cyclotransferase n=1 Tax=Spirosoma sp. KNUC1025 TaxID=2894082 RepID=UPI003862FD4C|nr:glutaminyl-peptide cyclotransferase [Spirosoma sp. KNUC1025]
MKLIHALIGGTIGVLLLIESCDNATKKSERSSSSVATPIISYSVKRTLPHDTLSFTEGLLVHKGQLFESTGSPDELLQARSLFGTVDTTTGKIDPKVELDRRKYFGEGIVILNGKLYQLTYKNKVGFIYDANTYRKIGQFDYKNPEGWGLTTDGRYLIMSDGTSTLTYLSADSLRPVKVLKVSENGAAVDKLNELEFIGGHIYANIWSTNTLIKIDTSRGDVVGRMDLSSLQSDAQTKYAKSLEMNGIAYDTRNNKVYVTGKMWPSIYEIEFAH